MKILFIIFPIFFLNQLFAQRAHNFYVKVVDATTKERLEGVTIQIKSLGKVFITDTTGSFSDHFHLGNYLFTFSFVGYETHSRQILIGNDKRVDILVEMKFSSSMLEGVSVRGSREEDAAARKVKDNVMPVTIITARQIENRASNLNELLARQAGVQIRRTGGLGSSAQISVRGLEGKRVQIFIDGNPLNTPDGSLGINDLPLQIIERIEIYKGTVPAWLGGDGLGSAVNVVLRHRDVSYVDATASYQSYNTVNTGLILKKTFDKHGVEVAGGVFTNSSDNDYVMESPYQSGLRIKRDHDKFQSILTGAAVRFRNLWFDEVEIEGAYIKIEKELQGIQRNIQHVRSDGKTTALVIGLRKSNLLNNKLSLKYHGVLANINVKLIDTSSFSYDWEGNKYPSLYGKGEFGNGPNLSTTIQKELRHQINLNYAINNIFALNLNNTFRHGRFNPRDDVGNEHANKNLYNYPGTLYNTITGLTLESRLADDNFLFSAAVKHYYNFVEGYNTNIYLQEPPDEVRNSVNTVGYNVGVRYNFTPSLMLKASHERAVRLPVNAELFGDGVLITPAIFLKPEVAYNYTSGIIYDKINKNDKHLQLEGNVFYMQVDQMIQLGGNGLTTGYVNYAKVSVRGADAEIKADLSNTVFASLNVTWQQLIDINKYIPGTQDVPNPTYKLQVPNIPAFFTNWNLEYHRDGLFGDGTKSRIIYEGTYVHEYNYGFAISVYDRYIIPSYHAHNLVLEQSFHNERFTISGEVNNITDEPILNNWNQPLPGRTFRIKLRYLLLGKTSLNINIK